MPHDTRHFDEELDALTRRLLDMGRLAEERLEKAITGLATGAADLIADVIGGDQPINELHLEVDDRCFKLLALRQPFATDLRVIVAVLKINADLERIGDLAVNIGEAAARYVTHPPPRPLADLGHVTTLASGMLHGALEALATRNSQMAHDVLAQDDELDHLRDKMFDTLLETMIKDSKTVEPAIDLILVARHLERIGDHATNIAEDVIFIVRAIDVRHHHADK
jgi:phosphate transport system protein